MPLDDWKGLPAGGIVVRDDAPRNRTGGWRTGLKPEAELAKCVDCLLCWLHCPDAAILVEAGAFTGIDLEYCKGCEICAEMCPTGAIQMVAEVPDAA
jgi:2-oxoacid:acceptor oxidoreductase delta subunit (pyruvate/2-ketoisovalerate family)